MKFIKILLLIIILSGCKNSTTDSAEIGTWYRCHENGDYWVYTITENYMYTIARARDSVTITDFIFICNVEKIDKDIIVLKNIENGGTFTIANEPLEIIQLDKNKIVLKNLMTNVDIELKKANFQFTQINSSNLEVWKNKTLSEFDRMVDLANCPDRRTEEEKIIPVIELEMPQEVEIPLTEIENDLPTIAIGNSLGSGLKSDSPRIIAKLDE